MASLENGEKQVRTPIALAALPLSVAVGRIAMKLKISGMLAIATFAVFWLLGSGQVSAQNASSLSG